MITIIYTDKEENVIAFTTKKRNIDHLFSSLGQVELYIKSEIAGNDEKVKIDFENDKKAAKVHLEIAGALTNIMAGNEIVELKY